MDIDALFSITTENHFFLYNIPREERIKKIAYNLWLFSGNSDSNYNYYQAEDIDNKFEKYLKYNFILAYLARKSPCLKN